MLKNAEKRGKMILCAYIATSNISCKNGRECQRSGQNLLVNIYGQDKEVF